MGLSCVNVQAFPLYTLRAAQVYWFAWAEAKAVAAKGSEGSFSR